MKKTIEKAVAVLTAIMIAGEALKTDADNVHEHKERPWQRTTSKIERTVSAPARKIARKLLHIFRLIGR